jgi:hypothetical protein
MVQLRNRNELASLLKKALEIEKGFENMSQWEGYVQARTNAFRDTLFTMISESEHHATMVTDMLDRLNVPKQDGLPLRVQLFDYSLREESEVMRELARNEKLAMDTYSNIRDSLKATDSSTWLSEEDRIFIMRYLQELILAEAEHVKLATKNLGKVERIR